MKKNKNVSVIGGAGHVGFPLGLILSSKGYNVFLIDQNKNKESINILKKQRNSLQKKYIIRFF